MTTEVLYVVIGVQAFLCLYLWQKTRMAAIREESLLARISRQDTPR